ncbi:unnamed protein product [Euphydryas editha]|uniref:PH domain-containing protein n=1 Tax=Euphydryas editha TaxID=104508 RepID=A0AAU9UEE8_EUPED|nr:unnamed protein product [Euphydryas editha]
MSSQASLKHVATEPSRLDSKRERRRGAAGRAAALRRAPSDSDCSGETASLSADSGDRSVRPAPPPPRSGKTRSRRRGSEWEVLEGLKDGQRFDKRPEVFNGYLHKKRKWPLKGWHKRFFVVDGGILVYARSPTDVARGRLHGSVDVGLSVISAKARRRRIDIDADEFIYHLRAKTPDVFRTWLNVLKAHRLYRQHLLTFGARESVPKIHAPNDEAPPTDTSSRPSYSSVSNSSIRNTWKLADVLVYPVCALTPETIPKIEQLKCLNQTRKVGTELDGKVPFVSTKLERKVYDHENLNLRGNENTIGDSINNEAKSPVTSILTTDAEKQMHSTDLELNNTSDLQSSLLCEFSINSPVFKNYTDIKSSKTDKKINLEYNDDNNDDQCVCSSDKVQPTPTLFIFSRKKREFLEDTNPVIRKSNKSTNLVKYRNMYPEPKLKTPLSKCMLLDKYISKNFKTKTHKIFNKVIKKHVNIQVETDKENKALQNSFICSDSNDIVEKLLISIFGNVSCDELDHDDIKIYLTQIVKDLYTMKLDETEVKNTPIRKLFQSLLEYWISNNTDNNIKELIKQSKSIDIQSNKLFARDRTTSNIPIESVTKATQFHGVSDFIEETVQKVKVDKQNKNNKLTPNMSDSFVKDRRIQELEKLLKNTVYICGTVPVSKSREKDIKITKKLIDNLDNLSQQNIDKNAISNDMFNNSDSSNELPKIQDTINSLISDISISANVAKDFLGAYLDLLRENDNNAESNSSTDVSLDVELKCDVQTESVQKKVSKSISTKEFGDTKQVKSQLTDPGQIFLKNVLEKVTTIFNKKNGNNINNTDSTNAINNWKGISFCQRIKDELGNFERDSKKSLVVDVSKYNLEHISMTNDLTFKGKASITMKLKEKSKNSGESQPVNLTFNFAEKDPDLKVNRDNSSDISNSDKFFNKKPITSCTVLRNSYMNIDSDPTSLKPYISSSEDCNENCFKKEDLNPLLFDSNTSSKAYIKINNNIMRTYKIYVDKDSTEPKVTNEFGAQPCFILSLNKTFASKLGLKKLSKDVEDKIVSITDVPQLTSTKNIKEELSVFDNVPKVIDEKFILLLLENISILSKNLPGIHKDITNLYVKLMKKHEKLNTNKIQGLSLLGQIYKESCNIKCSEDKETQFDETVVPMIDKNVNTSITNDINVKIKNCDKALSTEQIRDLIHKHVQINDNEIKIVDNKTYLPRKTILEVFDNTSGTQTSFSSLSSVEDIRTTDRATSNQVWYRHISTRDCAISTLIKSVLDSNDGSQNFRFKEINHQETKDKELPNKKFKYERKQSSKIRQELIREINLLAPSFKISTQSQTEKKLRCLRERHKNNDYKIYQLFLSKKYDVKKSCSMIEAALINDKSDDLKTIYRCTSYPSFCSGLVSPTSPPIRGPQAGFVSGTPGGRLAGWIIESGGPLDTVSRELGQAQLSVQQLQRLLEALELQQQTHHDTDVSLDGASPNVKKDRRKFVLRKKKSNNKCASVDLAPPQIDPSNSHMALSALTAPPSPGGGAASIPASAASLPIACAATRPQSLPGAEVLNAPTSLSSLTPDQQLREDFTVLAKDLVASLKSVVATLVRERGRACAGADGAPALSALRSDLSTALQQNSELRARLSRIHDASDLAEISSVGRGSDGAPNRQFQPSLSYSSSCVSASEFFDAEEHDEQRPPLLDDEAGVIELDGDSSSEAGSLSSEEGSASSDNSDAAMVSAERADPVTNSGIGDGPVNSWTRRTRLPSPRPSPGGPSLWNLLYKNIGKDLSQISMPVTINEPLNMLQRLCEELEYSELLEAAASCAQAAERCALVAAFAVSAYAAAAHRAASKPFNPLLAETYECVRADRGFRFVAEQPFNPLLAETYECVRADRGFRFVAEQVSHHPPISVCHAESPRWVFWQEARIKTKFWGKSMEFQPAGRVHVKLLTTGDHYSWNKVTTCVHNLFGGQRWVDQYGDMHITCHGTDISCKLNFIKASSWSNSRHEVRGAVTAGGTRLRLQGRWSEALYAGDPPAAKCLWRPGAMPPEHELYYGFTRFAIELNELEPGLRPLLPHTDTRFRPDQRALEEGDVEAAEQFKHQLEQAQRERRRDEHDHRPAWFRKVVEGGEEAWVFSGEYWRARELGFPSLSAPRLW